MSSHYPEFQVALEKTICRFWDFAGTKHPNLEGRAGTKAAQQSYFPNTLRICSECDGCRKKNTHTGLVFIQRDGYTASEKRVRQRERERQRESGCARMNSYMYVYSDLLARKQHTNQFDSRKKTDTEREVELASGRETCSLLTARNSN